MSDEPQRPTDDDRDAWKAYWAERGMPWRTEPEIEEERQRYLAERRSIEPDIGRGIYPFKGIKLTRADVEWLLATHKSRGMIGPIDWDDVPQRKRVGVDLRGAILRAATLDGLPLARMRGGLSGVEYDSSTIEQKLEAAAHFEGSSFVRTRLEGCALTHAHLEGANLTAAHLERADLYAIHLEAKQPANLRWASFDRSTKLDRIALANEDGVGPALDGVHWNGANLAHMGWSSVRVVADETAARQTSARSNKKRELPVDGYDSYLDGFLRAVRAYRQLAIALHNDGLNEDADRFAYRAQKLQRRVLRRQGRLGAALGSLFLDLIAGYGYRPARAFLAYVAVILAFAAAYLLNAQFAAPHLTWDEALVLSISSFHGRGFFTSGISLGDTLARLAAGEAIIGLVIEITFIATFTQRFFAR